MAEGGFLRGFFILNGIIRVKKYRRGGGLRRWGGYSVIHGAVGENIEDGGPKV